MPEPEAPAHQPTEHRFPPGNRVASSRHPHLDTLALDVEDIGVAEERETGDRPLISVVVPVRNGMPWIEQQLHALSAQELTGEWEAVVVDNGSEDGTGPCVELWSARDPRFRLVDASARRGAGAARNAGVRAARGSMVAFCDADDVVRPGWLAALVTALADSDVVAGVFDFGSLNGRGQSLPVPAATRQLGFLPFALAANLGVRTDAFKAVGGFRELIPVGEDVDLSWRMQLTGYRFAVTAAAVVAKRDHSSGRATLRAAWAYGRCAPSLFRRYRGEGMKRDLRGAAKSWAWLLATVPGLFSPSQRVDWLRTLGMRSGRLAASLKHHVFFP
jgi:glycosyltransferase involved in cell wall biosynthesis